MAKIAQNRPHEWEIERNISFVKARIPRILLFALPGETFTGFKDFDFTFSLPSLHFLSPAPFWSRPASRALQLSVYHSRVSAETGFGFRCISTTLPLLMRIILSAMAAKDWLWVITTTVRPVSRQVSCRSFRITLPVL